jgi:3-hydroxyacyl-CoA dehydrogenase/enoyl-CoA hydratase/3-hydroxybutyryl-CoA epimerase
MPMGPLRLIDEIGVDVTVDIAVTLEKAFGRRDHAATVLQWLRDCKMLGRKSGAGFYRYEGKTQSPNDRLTRWRDGLHGDPEGKGGPDIPAEGHGDPRSQMSDEDLTNRLALLMVNEAARCVEEGVVEAPQDADYGMHLGTGFPAYRGGPLRFADHFGIKRVVEQLERFAAADDKFAPADLLKKHAHDGTKFYEA